MVYLRDIYQIYEERIIEVTTRDNKPYTDYGPPQGKPVGFFNRHLVPMLVEFELEERLITESFTCFVISIGDQWFLLTAGHCIEYIEKAKNHGASVSCSLIDFAGDGAKDNHPIPFDLDNSDPFAFCEGGADYGLLALHTFYKRLFRHNRIKPLNERVWDSEPVCPDGFALLGCASEWADVQPNFNGITTTLHPIKELPEKPWHFEETDMPMFYGRIALPPGLDSIKGMSGGPIFAFKRTDDGKLRYWLFAIQSSWNKSTREISACKASPFIKSVKAYLAKNTI